MQCPSSSSSSRLFTPQSALPKKIKQQRSLKQQRQQQQTPRTNHPFPRTRPTPLLPITSKPKPNSKLESLATIIHNLESSVADGLDIIGTQTICTLLETCFELGAVEYGIRLHRLIPRRVWVKNAGVGAKLVRMYAASGLLEDAHKVFDEMSERNGSAFVWNSLMSGYNEAGRYEEALALYFQMEEEGVEIDGFTFPRALKACAGIGVIEVGEEVFRHVVRYGFHGDGFVMNALVGMYARCGDVGKARRVFDLIRDKDLVSWNSMITGYFHHGLVQEAMSVFNGMIATGFEPDVVSLLLILKGVSLMRIGDQIHGWVLRRGLDQNLTINNALISFYSYHGKLEQVRWLFSQMPEKDVASWNSIISAHSKDPSALKYFQQMQKEGVAPDSITFLSLLSTCANTGLVNDGERLFLLMRKKHGLVPSIEHYGCMVNLYGRAGLIDKAYEMVSRGMEFEAGPTVWGALLYACCLHGNAEIGEIAAKKLFELEPDNKHNFELLMRIYEGLGRLDDVETVLKMMMDRVLDS